MTKKTPSTFESFLADDKQKQLFDKEYREVLLSELILALMDEDHVSVRGLAKEAGISPTVVQELRTGKKKNITLDTFLKIMDACGRAVIVESLADHEKIKFTLEHS